MSAVVHPHCYIFQAPGFSPGKAGMYLYQPLFFGRIRVYFNHDGRSAHIVRTRPKRGGNDNAAEEAEPGNLRAAQNCITVPYTVCTQNVPTLIVEAEICLRTAHNLSLKLTQLNL